MPSRTDKKCLCSVQVAPGEMQFLMSTAALPMVAKPIYGIISDSVYIKGAHRVPYLVIAGEDFMYLFSFFFFFLETGERCRNPQCFRHPLVINNA